jgi:hypothetical protein
MTKALAILLSTFLLIACETKQWNLNKSIGWESINPEDYTVLFVRWDSGTIDLNQLNAKKQFDNRILEKLISSKLGDPAENDERTEIDMHFLVEKKYKKALRVIISFATTDNTARRLTVYQRHYDSFGKWYDKPIHSVQKHQ